MAMVSTQNMLTHSGDVETSKCLQHQEGQSIKKLNMAMSMPDVRCFDDVFPGTKDLDDAWSRMSLAEVDNVRTSRCLLQLGPMNSDIANWKLRVDESVRQASRRTIHLQERLEMSSDKPYHRTASSTFLHDVESDTIEEDDRDSTTVPIVSHSGWLIKRAHRTRSFKRRLFCILGQELVYHRSHESSTCNGTSGISGKVNLDLDTVLQPIPNHGFKLIQGSSTMLLYALNDSDRDSWIRKLQNCGAVVSNVPVEKKNVVNKVIASGWLRKQGQLFKSVKRRWFELTGVGLKYYRNPEATRAKGFVPINMNSSVTRLDMRKTGERFSFGITENKLEKRSRVLLVYADSQEDRSVWIAALASVIDGQEPLETALPSPLDASCLERSISDEISPTNESGHDPFDVSDEIESVREADEVRDIVREAQLILISPYSPEGTTSENFLKSIQRKTLSIDSVRKFMEGLMEYMVQTRMHYFRSIYGDSDDSFDVVAQIISEQVEERVFSPIHRFVYQYLVTKQDSRALSERLDLLRDRKQDYFGIHPTSPSGYAAAIAAMNAIDCQSLPSLKRKQLVRACKTIYSVAAEEHLYPAAMSADDFIPAFIYVVVQCQIEDVLTLKELLVAFPPVSDSGETAYFVTCLEIAIEYVQSLVLLAEVELDGDQPLGITFGLQDNFVVVQEIEEESQAAISRDIQPGDVLMTVNGLCVYDREIPDLTKILETTSGVMALAFVSVKDYKRMKAKLSRE